MSVMREETFGPVIGLMSVSGDDEALSLMNDTRYGLTASVFSASQTRATAMMSKLNAGTVYWNCCDRVSATTPWTGWNQSGIGSTLSDEGIRAFLKPKAWHLRAP
jgi:acyl-CoA reductase-like NAD-dependent aldehyde dehydrogenase